MTDRTEPRPPSQVHNAQGEFEGTPEAARLAAEAAELRAMRLSYRQIAERQGVSIATAHDRVKRALAAVPVEAVDQLRSVELEHLDSLARVLLLITPASSGATRTERIQAVRELRQISESRRKLLGLDAPTNINLLVTDQMQAEIDAMIAEARAAGIDIVDESAGRSS